MTLTATLRNSCDDPGIVVSIANTGKKTKPVLVDWFVDGIGAGEQVDVLAATSAEVVLDIPERVETLVTVTSGRKVLLVENVTRDCTPPEEEPPDEEHHALWSDPETWHEGVVPGPADIAHVDHCIILDTDVRVSGVHIEGPEGWLIFEPGTSLTLESSANVVLMGGKLTMRPASPDVVHTLRFVGVDEQAFVGGGMEVLDTDVGVWVMGDGVLDLEGSEKTAWVRPSFGFATGDNIDSLALTEGWRLGDEIVVVPTAWSAGSDVSTDYDRVQLGHGEPLTYNHPAFDAGGYWAAPELLNLTRNVRIEGTPGGRSHVFMSTTVPQTICYVEFSHLGPRRMVDVDGQMVSKHPLGRWPVHFHMMGEAARGSLIEGCVAHDVGTHAFVSHLSNGITWRDDIAHDVLEAPFWWDTGQEMPVGVEDPPSNDIRYEHCVASLFKMGDQDSQHHAFLMGKGTGSAAIGCVAVGGEGHGFLWTTRSAGLWEFTGNVAHNNAKSGTRFWGNNKVPQPFVDFVAYHNQEHGSFAGAYRNTNQYLRCIWYGNGRSAFEQVAQSKEDAPVVLDGCVLDGAGVSDFALTTGGHQLETILPVYIRNSVLRGGKVACVQLVDTEGVEGPHMLQFDGCTFEGELFVAEAGATGFLIVDGVRVWEA